MENIAEPAGNDIRREPRRISGPFLGRNSQGGRGPSHEHSVGRAPHPRGAQVQDVSVNHCGADVPVAQQLLDGRMSWLSPPAGSVEWWPKELASRVAISRVLEGNIRDRHQAPQLLQSEIPDGPPSVEGPDLWPATTGAGNCRPSWLTSDHYFEAELERPIRLQVVAGPRIEPANLRTMF